MWRCTLIVRYKTKKSWFKNRSNSTSWGDTISSKLMIRKIIKFCQDSALVPRSCLKILARSSKSLSLLRCHLRLRQIHKLQTHHKIQMRKTRRSRMNSCSSHQWMTIRMKKSLRKFSRFYQLCKKALRNSLRAPKLHHVRSRPKIRVSTNLLRKSSPSTFNQSLFRRSNKYKKKFLTKS